jgi:hypothetical protein
VSLDTDIDVMLADFGVPMVHGSNTGLALEDIADQDMAAGITAALGEVRILTVRTAAFPGIAVGSAVTVSGEAYIVRDRKRVGDGRLTLLALGAAS